MQTHIRTFIALKIKPEQNLLNQLSEFKQLFKYDKVRWVDPNNMHLTLRFIGNTTREQLYSLVDELETISKQDSQISLSIKGAGYFASKGKPRVLFAKISDSIPLLNLARAIENAVLACGFHNELKVFRPHLTLGRIKTLESRIRFRTIIEELQIVEYQNTVVDEFIIYQSILESNGPIYKPIKTFRIS